MVEVDKLDRFFRRREGRQGDRLRRTDEREDAPVVVLVHLEVEDLGAFAPRRVRDRIADVAPTAFAEVRDAFEDHALAIVR